MQLKWTADNERSLGGGMQDITADDLPTLRNGGAKAEQARARPPVPMRRRDLRRGAFRDTGRPLDLVVDGPGFLVIDTPHGERLARGGSLVLDDAGRLTDAQDNPVLGTEGPIVLRAPDVDVWSDGTIMDQGIMAGRLRLVTVPEHSTLLREGFGRYSTDAGLEPARQGISLRQGSIEDPRVDPLASLVDLVSIQRAYLANLEARRALDSDLAAVAGEVDPAP